MFVANVGLTQLIAISLPVLLAIYPLAIVLVLLSFFDQIFFRKSYVYIIALVVTGIISAFEGLRAAGLSFEAIDRSLSFLPLFEQGIGWLVPAAAGTVLGIIISRFTGNKKKVPLN